MRTSSTPVASPQSSLAALVLALALAAFAACANGNEAAAPPGSLGTDASVETDATVITDSSVVDSPSLATDAPISASTLKIQPADPVLAVTIVDGVITSAPLPFTALANGATPVAASWSIDRGELGLIAATGTFTPSGTLAGVGNVIAKYGSVVATTTLTVTIKSTQNGRPAGSPPQTGTGGEGLGNPVDGNTKAGLQGTATPPASAQELGWLYPYDKTVWPRGVLAPLLQWQTQHSTSAVYIHLTQKYFEFEGFYGGSGLVHQPIDQTTWKQALYGNTGDPLKVEVKVWDGSKAYGPLTEQWTVAPGVLKGTVYYDSYSSQLTGSSNGVVLAIKPGASSPTLAVPGTSGQCLVCHEISANGGTLIAQHDGNNNRDGTSYDLTNNGAPIASYYNNAPDGTYNGGKFTWSAVYPDGSFAMASSRYTRESYLNDSHLFARADGNQIAATGWDGVVKTAVTPTFSPDGKMLAFNFWEGIPTNGVQQGLGRSLAVMDFACGGADGGVGCGAPPYTFSNARELYRDTTLSRFVGWPSFLPDGKWLVFHNTITYPKNWNLCPAAPDASTQYNCVLTTWNGAQAELWGVDVPATSATAASPIPLDALNGKGYLPTNTQHPNDAILNYEPTVNPIASGGFYWVVFTSRRMYGNVAAGDPYDNGSGTYPIPKKLWVAAIDVNPQPGKDPSHPAFYLPGQELYAGNMRGHWVVDPCKANGGGCETGDECCNGYCRQPEDGGALVCTDKPQGCAQEFEKCTTDGDCCGASAGYTCLNGHCARPPVN